MKNHKLITIIVFGLMILITGFVLIKTDFASKIFKTKADITLQSNETMFLTGREVNTKIKVLGGATLNEFWGTVNDDWKNENITKIRKATSIDSKYKTSDNIVSTSDSAKPIYMWYEDKIIYYYTEATTIYLNPDSSDIFSYLTKLTSIDIVYFNTSKVTDMSFMFEKCNSLTSINLSNFNTSNVTTMLWMFDGCSSLTSIDLSHFNTSKVTDMSNMFGGCHSLTSIDVSSFNTSNVTNMHGMFGAYDTNSKMNLKSIIGIEKFNTSKVTNMSTMFWGCAYITSLNLNNFNTSKVTDMSHMFDGCEALTTLDLSSFDTSKVTNIDLMFEDCTHLTKIYVSNSFTTSKVTSTDRVFYRCLVLTGGNGTKYNENKVDKTYARIDASGTPGYFTEVYKINYHGNGGTYNDKDTYLDPRSFKYGVTYPGANDGKALIYTNENFFKREGYEFKGWKTKSGYAGWYSGYTGESDKLWKWKNGDYHIGDETPYQLDLYAQWEPITYKIKYHGNGGVYGDKTEWIDNRNFVYNEIYPNSDALPMIYTNENFFKRDGYTFNGWKTKAGYTGWEAGYSGNNTKKWQWYDGYKENNVSIGVGDEVLHQLDLYAVWEPIIYKVNYHGNGGTYGSLTEYMDPRDFKYGVTFPGANDGKTLIYTNENFFTKAGYIFIGWATKKGYTGWNKGGYIGNKTWRFLDGEYGVGDETAHQLDLYAQWEEEKEDVYIITYNLNDGFETVNNPRIYTENSEDIMLANPEKEGYVFIGWIGSNGPEAQTNVIIKKGSTGNKTYTAVYKRDISDLIIELDKEEYEYTGLEIKPNITIRDEEYILEENEDYELTYSNNIDIGKGLVTILGINDYTNGKIIEFKISKIINLTNLDVRENSIMFNEIKTLNELKNNLQTEEITLKDKDGNIKDNSSKLGTGNILVLGDKTYTVSIKGDLTGDGETGFEDVFSSYYYFKNSNLLTDIIRYATDFNNDNAVGFEDVFSMYYLFKNGTNYELVK